MNRLGLARIAIICASIISFRLFIGPVAVASYSAGKPSQRTAFVHLFEWKWTDIAKECETFLGPKGFAAVQVSPPQEHAIVEGRPWFERYQPVSYKLESRSGTREEFIDMVHRCKAVGVNIYADAVINHMAWVNRTNSPKYGNAGSIYNYLEHPGLYKTWDFHQCDNIINDYSDRGNVQFCNVGTERNKDCADLATESGYVRGKLTEFMNDLTGIGVAGFRIDAAKHMPSTDLDAIFSRVKGNPYYFLEVIGNDSEPIKVSEYLHLGNVTEFKFGRELARVFRWGRLAWLEHFGEMWGMLPSYQAVAFLDNHDTERSDPDYVLTYKAGKTYVLGNVFMLAWPYGYPSILSSYPFSDTNAGPPRLGNGETLPVYENGQPSHCFKEWGCQHRITAIANMVGFRNYTVTDWNVTKWWSNGSNQIAFARGNKGYIVINNEGQSMDQVFDTGLPAGTYCDVITGEVTTGRSQCSGRAVTVGNDGRAQIHVEPYDAVAIHGGEKLQIANARR